MGKIDEIAELAARLGGQAPRPQYSRMAAESDDVLDLWPPTDAEIDRWVRAMDAPKPKQTMDRFAPVLEARGIQSIGTIKDVEASLIGMPSHAVGPGGLEPNYWTRVLSGFPNSPTSTPVYVTNPVEAVASQYPPSLRQQAIETARQFEMPVGEHGRTRFQAALALEDPKAVILAYPRRRAVEPGAAGLVHYGALRERPGLVEVAAGKGNSPAFFDRVLLHELRHTLEGAGTNVGYRYGGYQDWRMPRSLALGPSQKNYLGLTGEEVARFGDARARYAHHSGRLIADQDEAERAAELILSNQFGLGEGFYAPERAFYKAARDSDPAIRAHQNRLLQSLLSVPAVIGAGATQDQQ